MKYIPLITILVTSIVLGGLIFWNQGLSLSDRLDIHENVLIELNNRLEVLEAKK